MSATRVLLYEFVTGGGGWSLASPQPPGGTMLAEGAAMLQSLAHDLLAIENLELHLLADSRLAPFWPAGCRVHSVDCRADERRLLCSLAANSDITLVIAPEFDDLLGARCRWAANAGGNLLTPDDRYVALAANKHELAEHLQAAGLPVPPSVVLSGDEPPPDDFPFPAVLKPCDGAGSLDVRLLATAADLTEFRSARQTWRLEAFQPGIPVSIALLCGPIQTLALQPGRQLLSTDGQFRYLGSQWPLAEGQRARAGRLAARVASAMPATRGYVGIDLVLGEAPDGSNDVVIEVNPRLTTSYVGLRQLATTNLAEAMLRVATGQTTTVAWRDPPITYRVGDTSIGALTCPG